MRVLIAGGSGYIGSHLSASLRADGHEVVVLTRSPQVATASPGVRSVQWDPHSPGGAWIGELSRADAVVNLAGASVGGGRWTRRMMADIQSSRLTATSAMVEALKNVPRERRPRVLVNASGIDYYGDRGDEVITEESGPGSSFLARMSQQWEAAALPAQSSGTRVVMIRTSMVFGRGAPAFRLLTLPVRLFVGGPFGSGRQWFTWIHVQDIVGLYRIALETDGLSGPMNAVAPDVRRQRDLVREIGRVLRRPSVFPVPAFLLRLVLGEMAQLLLDGRRATPEKAQALGYRFRFGGLPEALGDLLR